MASDCTIWHWRENMELIPVGLSVGQRVDMKNPKLKIYQDLILYKLMKIELVRDGTWRRFVYDLENGLGLNICKGPRGIFKHLWLLSWTFLRYPIGFSIVFPYNLEYMNEDFCLASKIDAKKHLLFFFCFFFTKKKL